MKTVNIVIIDTGEVINTHRIPADEVKHIQNAYAGDTYFRVEVV